jgi:hypothetical protein
MANNKKLTKAELNQTLPIPLAKGVLKKTNRGQLLKMLDDLNQKIEIEEVNHHDDCLCDICSEQRITSEAEVVEVSPNVFEQEVNLTDEEIAQQEARKQKTLDNIQKAGERHAQRLIYPHFKVTVGGELRSAENTPEVIQDKTPEENAQLDYEHKLKIKAMDYQASLAKAQGNMIQGMVQDYEYRCVEIVVEDETGQVSKQIECVLDHNAKQAIVIGGDIILRADKDMYKSLYKPLNVATPKRGGSAKGSEINDFIEATLSSGDVVSLAKLAQMLGEKFGGKLASYQTRLTGYKNPKYSELSTLLVEQKVGEIKALLLDTDSRVDRSIAKFHKDHPWAQEEIQAQEEVQETIKVESTNPRKPNGGPVTKIVEEAIAA